MPLRVGTAAGTTAAGAKLYRGTAPATITEADHGYIGNSPHEVLSVFSRPSLPTITSFTLTPGEETEEQRTARNAPLTAAWAVAATSTASQVTYNYGTVLTVGESATGHFRRGYSIQHGFGSVSVASTIGRISFITYFESTPAQTVGSTLNTHFFIRNDFAQLTDQTQATPRALDVNGVRYLMEDRPDGRGFTSVMAGVPPFVVGQTYNIQVWVGGTAGQPSTWQAAFPNTLTATRTAPAVYPPVALAFTLANGTRSAISIVQGGTGNVTIPTPTQDGVATLTATNIEGPVHALARYNLRQRLRSLTLQEVADTTGATNNIQSRIGINAAWTADPTTAASLTVSGYPSLNIADLLRNTPLPTSLQRAAWHTTRWFIIPRGATQQTVTFTLSVTGVNAQNAAATLTTTLNVTVPARVGG